MALFNFAMNARHRKPPKRKEAPRPRGDRLDRQWLDELRDTARPGKVEAATHLVTKALEAYTKQDFRRAASLASEARELVPRSARIRELAGLAHYNSGNWREAVRELLTYRRLTGRVDQNHVIADSYRGLGRPEKAIEICGQVSRRLVSQGIWTELVVVAASAYADNGQIDKALAQLARGELEPKSVEPHHLRLWYVRADLLERAGRQREAQSVLRRISAEDPDFYDVSRRLVK